MSDSVRPQRRQPTRLPHPWDFPGKNTGVGCHFLLQCMKVKVKVKSLSRVWLLATPWTAAYQAPPSTGFSRQEYWSGVPVPPPSYQTATTPQGRTLRKLRMWKHRILVPESWGTYKRNEFSDPILLHLLIQKKKALNSFTWYLVFFNLQ